MAQFARFEIRSQIIYATHATNVAHPIDTYAVACYNTITQQASNTSYGGY